jgi:adenylyltransferase/sulfurtransferase
MSVEVMVPTALRGFTEGRASVATDGTTVGEVLHNLTTRYSSLRAHLYDKDGKLRNFVGIFLNNDDVRELQRDATPVKDGDVLLLIPAIAGGSPGAVAYPSLSKLRSTERELSHEQMRRYSRHLILPEVGLSGQRKLLDSSVLLVGAGGLGAPLALYLGAAGVGKIGLVDFDVVEPSNLQRQVLFSTSDVGKSKLDGAEARLRSLNPDIEVVKHNLRLEASNALSIIGDYDVVVDGTDNFPTRYLVNDAAIQSKVPSVYGSIYRFEGQVSLFGYKGGPCYRCIYPEPPPPGLVPSCAEGGVLGVLPGIVGSLQALEAIKVLLGKGDTLSGRLLLFDALGLKFRELKVRRNKECPVCGDSPTQKGLIDYQEFCGLREIPEDAEHEIEVEELKQRLEGPNPPVLLDVREPMEYEIVKIPGAKLIPLMKLPDRVHELSGAGEIVVYCHSGGRSATATRFLLEMGFQKVKNLRGGVDAWATRVDPRLPTY